MGDADLVCHACLKTVEQIDLVFDAESYQHKKKKTKERKAAVDEILSTLCDNDSFKSMTIFGTKPHRLFRQGLPVPKKKKGSSTTQKIQMMQKRKNPASKRRVLKKKMRTLKKMLFLRRKTRRRRVALRTNRRMVTTPKKPRPVRKLDKFVKNSSPTSNLRCALTWRTSVAGADKTCPAMFATRGRKCAKRLRGRRP